MTYKTAGVDIAEANRFVEAIRPLVATTKRRGSLGTIGGFGGLFKMPMKDMADPVLVASTDGVGTKLLVANVVDKHDTIGIDLVAMCVNDIITCGAEPLFMLDYLATGRLDSRRMAEVVEGIVKGCREANCALIGGETAEMPGLYSPDDYDIAGFCVGVIDRKKLIDGHTVKVGDALLGLASSGIHSNGLSLARQVFSEDEMRVTWGRQLLKPTQIYVKPVLALVNAGIVKALANITGGGFHGNIPRCLPEGMSVEVDRSAWQVPNLFLEIQRRGRVEDGEMFRTYNMGIGMVAIVSAKRVDEAQKALSKLKLKSGVIGKVVEGDGKVIL